MAEAALWERLRASGRVEDVETFLRLYPNSYLAAAAQRRREELLGHNAASAAAAGRPRRRRPRSRRAAERPAAATPAPASPPVAEKPKAPDKLAALQPIVPPSEPPPPPPRRDLPWSCRRSLRRRLPAMTHVFQDCPTCVRMVRIPAGTLMMGQGAKDPSALPAHKVSAAGVRAQPVSGDGRGVECLPRRRRLRTAAAHGGGAGRHADPQCQLGRRAALHHLAVAPCRPHLPPADRGGMGVRGPRRHGQPLLVGRPGRHGAWPTVPAAAARRIRERRCPWTTFQPNPFGLYGMLGRRCAMGAGLLVPELRQCSRPTARRGSRRAA